MDPLNNLYLRAETGMDIFIKNMVCVRCKMAVRSVLEDLGIQYSTINLGRVELSKDISEEQKKELDQALRYYELELMTDKKKIIVERTKTLIIDLFSSSGLESQLIYKFSDYLSRSLSYDYTYLANIFSEHEQMTIERFYILRRIDRVKELIVYEGLSVKEIAFSLNFSSVSHLSVQFKKVTGQTPRAFKKLCEDPEFIWKGV
jgi:AraC-like DNA-binding protein